MRRSLDDRRLPRTGAPRARPRRGSRALHEAERATSRGERSTDPNDVASRPCPRPRQARGHRAGRGPRRQAVSLGRTDGLPQPAGDALLDFAHILHQAGRLDEPARGPRKPSISTNRKETRLPRRALVLPRSSERRCQTRPAVVDRLAAGPIVRNKSTSRIGGRQCRHQISSRSTLMEAGSRSLARSPTYRTTNSSCYTFGSPNPEPLGAGLAIDCVNGAPAAVLDKEKFRLTVAPAGSGNLGVFGTFVEGPATASAIAFLVPKQPNPRGLVTEVLEWSRIITLSKSQKHVDIGTTPEGQGKSA